VNWWEWLLLLPIVVVGLLVVFVARLLGEDQGDRMGAWILGRPGMAERIKRRPVAFRVGSALVIAGLLPYLVMLHALVTGREFQADSGTLAAFVTGAAGLIISGLTILTIWWHVATDPTAAAHNPTAHPPRSSGPRCSRRPSPRSHGHSRCACGPDGGRARLCFDGSASRSGSFVGPWGGADGREARTHAPC
jgi:hypothetical protein